MFFNGHLVGSSPETGYSAPDFCRIAEAYGLRSCRINSQDNLNKLISDIINSKDSVLCEVMMSPDQPLIPLSMVCKSEGYIGSPIEVMYPFLSDEEQNENMLI